MKMHEKFYYKVQCDVLEIALKHTLAEPLCTVWLPGFYYVTVNRRVFFIVPFDDYFLSQSFYREPYNLGVGQCSCLSEVYYVEESLQICTETGRLRSVATGDIYREFILGDDLFYINWSYMKNFPKQIKMAASSPTGPVFIYSSLNTLLGGVWPTQIEPDESKPDALPEISVIGETAN